MTLWQQNSIREQIDLVKKTVAKGCSDLELELFILQCERTGLDPFARQIYAIKRYDQSVKAEVMQTQVSIDGLRKLADDTGMVAGQEGPFWCGSDGHWRDVWLAADPPRAARVVVLRSALTAMGQPSVFTGVALWSSYCQTTREGQPTRMWKQMGPEMLAKCAEAQALRKAFPMKLSGLYTSDEMGQADNETRPDQGRSTQRPLERPVTASTPDLSQSPVLAPPRPLDGDSGASEGTREPDPLLAMRRMVSGAIGQLSPEDRSTVLAKGDQDRLQLPDEKGFAVSDANKWMKLIAEVKA